MNWYWVVYGLGFVTPIGLRLGWAGLSGLATSYKAKLVAEIKAELAKL